MYKYTYHHSPLSAEEQQRPATHAGDTRRSESRSSLDSEDDAATERVAKLRQTLKSLQSQLFAEKKMLAKEHQQTCSMLVAGGQPSSVSSGKFSIIYRMNDISSGDGVGFMRSEEYSDRGKVS